MWKFKIGGTLSKYILRNGRRKNNFFKGRIKNIRKKRLTISQEANRKGRRKNKLFSVIEIGEECRCRNWWSWENNFCSGMKLKIFIFVGQFKILLPYKIIIYTIFNLVQKSQTQSFRFKTNKIQVQKMSVKSQNRRVWPKASP